MTQAGMTQAGMTQVGFERHVAACNNVALPADRLALRLDGAVLGWADPGFSGMITASGIETGGPGGFELREASELERLGQALAAAGKVRFRNEPFDIVARPGAPSLGRIDRGALPGLGLIAAGVHLNGIVEQPDGPYLWVGRRAADKALDPGKLDHLVAGGVAAGFDADATLVKEGEEESGLSAELAARAVKVAEISYCMKRAEGLRRDLLHCYDLELPPDWVPVANDGEVAEFRLLPLGLVFETVRDSDDFKFNVNLVLIDLFLRRGLIDAASPEGRRLRAGLEVSL